MALFAYRYSPRTLLFFFFNDTATTEIYTLSLHDALPIFVGRPARSRDPAHPARRAGRRPLVRSNRSPGRPLRRRRLRPRGHGGSGDARGDGSGPVGRGAAGSAGRSLPSYPDPPARGRTAVRLRARSTRGPRAER